MRKLAWNICPNCRKRITKKEEHVIGYARGNVHYKCDPIVNYKNLG